MSFNNLKLGQFVIILVLAMTVIGGCGDNSKVTEANQKLSEGPTDLGNVLVTAEESDPNPPSVDPGTDPDGDPNPPGLGGCKYKIQLNVAKLEFQELTGPVFEVAATPAQIDLCALSQDFFGTINQAMSPVLTNQNLLKQIQLTLQESGHAVYNGETNEKICDLRVPPGATAGMRFQAKPDHLSFDITKIAIFNYDQDNAFHILGNQQCQLLYPVGNYWIQIQN